VETGTLTAIHRENAETSVSVLQREKMKVLRRLVLHQTRHKVCFVALLSSRDRVRSPFSSGNVSFGTSLVRLPRANQNGRPSQHARRSTRYLLNCAPHMRVGLPWQGLSYACIPGDAHRPGVCVDGCGRHPRCPTHMTGHDAHSTDQMCFIGSVDLQTVDVTRSMYVDGSSPGIPRIIPPAR